MTKPLPQKVKARLSEKREDGSVIGTCKKCSEELFARKDGILRDHLFEGNAQLSCVDYKGHLLGRFYHSGPRMWIAKWGERTDVEWVSTYLRWHELGLASSHGGPPASGAKTAANGATNAKDCKQG